MIEIAVNLIVVVVNIFNMIRPATNKDYSSVCDLLASENLPTIDVDRNLSHFFVMTEQNEIVGSIGMELYGQSALLRSMAVASDHRSKGIAMALINELMAYAKEKRVSDMFLITNTAEQYFQRVGFKKIPREEVKEVVLQSKEFNGLCPASSAIMMKEL